jgi:hypothetical protein
MFLLGLAILQARGANDEKLIILDRSNSVGAQLLSHPDLRDTVGECITLRGRT